MTFKDSGGNCTILSNAKFGGNSIKFVVSEESKEPRVMLRQRMPLTSVAIVEEALGENRFVISDADTPVQLTAKQEKLNNLFNQLNDYGCMKTPELSKIKVGDVYLYRSSDELCVYRVCILGVEDMFVSFRLIDFGICKTANYNSLYIMSAYFDDIRDTPAFVTRINLPPDEVLYKYGLPTSSMIKQGDIVEVIKFTTTEPQFGIFGFARNNKYRAKPEKFTTGFNEEQKKNWLSLFDSETMFENPSILPGGYQSLGQRELDNCLALVSYVKALDKVYVHDFESAVRLSMMQERMDIIYGNEESRKNFVIGDWDKLVAGFGCVAYNKTLNAYVRVKVVSISKEQIEVFPADVTHLGTFFVARDEVFRVPSSLSFPRQHLTIRMCRDSESSNHYMMTKLARCVIPTGTLVILNSDEDGLVTIRCANAPDGVLKKIGFFDAGLSKARAHDTYQKSSFGADFKPERIEDLSESMSKLKCMSKSKSIVKKPNVSSSKMAQSKQDVAKTAEVVEPAEQKV